jgi:hypothetical protein
MDVRVAGKTGMSGYFCALISDNTSNKMNRAIMADNEKKKRLFGSAG